MKVVVDVFFQSNNDLMVSEVNIQILDGAAAINISLPACRHEKNGAGICRLKAQKEVQEDEGEGVKVDPAKPIDDDPRQQGGTLEDDKGPRTNPRSHFVGK